MAAEEPPLVAVPALEDAPMEEAKAADLFEDVGLDVPLVGRVPRNPRTWALLARKFAADDASFAEYDCQGVVSERVSQGRTFPLLMLYVLQRHGINKGQTKIRL